MKEREKMNEQIQWSDYLNPNRFCKDEDINAIVSTLDALVEEHGLNTRRRKFEIWDHCPQYGYRLSYTIGLTRAQNENDELHNAIQKLSTLAKTKQIDLSAYAPHFFTEDANEEGSLNIYSTYMDTRRKKSA